MYLYTYIYKNTCIDMYMYEPINKKKNNQAYKTCIVMIAHTQSHRENGEKYIIVKKRSRHQHLFEYCLLWPYDSPHNCLKFL